MTALSIMNMRQSARYQRELSSDPNGVYWQARLNNALDVIAASPKLSEFWDSDFVPAKASYCEHALLAEEIVKAGRLAEEQAAINDAMTVDDIAKRNGIGNVADWLTNAIAECEEWLDYFSTRESVRP